MTELCDAGYITPNGTAMPCLLAHGHAGQHEHIVDGSGVKWDNAFAKQQESIKQRAGDQPLPTKNDHPYMQDLVMKDIEDRKALGLKRYGTLLQPHNGRDFLLDAYQEALDLCVYLRGVMFERDGR